MCEDLQDLVLRPTITVDAASRLLGISRNATYEAVRNGELESVRFGKRRLVLSGPLRRKLGIEVMP